MNITQPVFREWTKYVPFIQPCYFVGHASSRAIISIMRENRIPMICDNLHQASVVNDYSLVIEENRFGTNEYIARNMKDLNSSRAPLWVYAPISSDGIAQTREMFEYIWAHKLILNGIVFDTRNFSDKNAAIPQSMYSYKIAFDYLFRNMIEPFKKEYGIHTPCIMIDGRNHITRLEHLKEMRHSAFECMTSTIQLCNDKKIELRLIVDSLFDRIT